MRQGQNTRRSRGRSNNNNNGGGGGGNGGGGGGGGGGGNGGGGQRRQNAPMRHQTFDSNGPDVRIRGNAWQVFEKYQTLARDAASSGDRVMSENYLQHAEHYFRIIAQIQEAEARQQQQRGQHGGHQPNGGGPQPPSQPLTSMNGDDDGDDDGDENQMDERGMVHA
jgi:hypothetical protein